MVPWSCPVMTHSSFAMLLLNISLGLGGDRVTVTGTEGPGGPEGEKQWLVPLHTLQEHRAHFIPSLKRPLDFDLSLISEYF